MKKGIKILFVFSLFMDNQLVGYETHAIDPDIGNYVGIYHRKIDEKKYKTGYPVTLGDKHYIFHDNKTLTT